ncbi:MAG: hypothetical protein LIP77_02565, partial [Planctomycetes bacterium]|nr:hypothetical protein [Planctomycetota bacterium]
MTEAGVADTRCRLCGNEAEFAFDRPSDLLGQTFSIYTCDACRFAFVANPCLDFARIYDEAYYRGEGADTLVRYLDELDRPEGCLRTLEWDGIALWVREVAARKSLANPRILDFGCGNGLLADYLSRHGFAGCVGGHRGWMADTAPQ